MWARLAMRVFTKDDGGIPMRKRRRKGNRVPPPIYGQNFGKIGAIVGGVSFFVFTVTMGDPETQDDAMSLIAAVLWAIIGVGLGGLVGRAWGWWISK